VTAPLFRLDQVTGYFPFQACRFDRRFSYGVYVPRGYVREKAAEFRLLVAMHGSERSPEVARELFVDLAEEAQCIVLAPLFPIAVTDDEETHNYIFLKYRDIRFDHVLLAMIDEVVERFGVSGEKFLLAGFSGGGQFANRFMYLHASRLSAVSIGAPGIVNTLDETTDWFVGVRDVLTKFGQGVDREGLRGLPVQVVVGADDVESDIVVAPPSALYMDGVNNSGPTRLERAKYLHRLLRDAGVDASLDVVPGAAHCAAHVQLAVNGFFRRQRFN
jgi:pimeloyl-ACP methyl ester carboxylesterase